jgi:hypothetical protein
MWHAVPDFRGVGDFLTGNMAYGKAMSGHHSEKVDCPLIWSPYHKESNFGALICIFCVLCGELFGTPPELGRYTIGRGGVLVKRRQLLMGCGRLRAQRQTGLKGLDRPLGLPEAGQGHPQCVVGVGEMVVQANRR